MKTTIAIQWARKESVPDLVECDLGPHAKTRDDIEKMGKAAAKEQSPTRLKVAVVRRPDGTDWHCGGVHYEVTDAGYHVDWLVAHPEVGDQARRALLENVMVLAATSGKRKVVTVDLPDVDASYPFFKALRDMGLEGPELQRSEIARRPDAWRFTWVHSEVANDE